MGEIDHEAKVEERKSKRGKLREEGEAGAEEKEKGDGQGRERENEGEREYRERRRTSRRRRRWWRMVEVVRRLPLNKCDRVRSSC